MDDIDREMKCVRVKGSQRGIVTNLGNGKGRYILDAQVMLEAHIALLSLIPFSVHVLDDYS